MENLLGEHSNLVNLDSLVQPKRGQANQPQPGAKNPFAEQPNPFQAAAAPKPSMNELRGGNQVKNYTNLRILSAFLFRLLFQFVIASIFQQQPAPQLGGWPNQSNSDINPFF